MWCMLLSQSGYGCVHACFFSLLTAECGDPSTLSSLLIFSALLDLVIQCNVCDALCRVFNLANWVFHF